MLFSDNQDFLLIIREKILQWRQTYLVTTRKGIFVNSANQQLAICVSEGQGYGMLITIKAAALGWCQQSDFDLLVSYYLNHRISSTNPLMSWQQIQKGMDMITENQNQTSAIDGDMDIAYALLLADELWGFNNNFNYYQIALEILSGLLHHCFQDKNQLLMVGDWAKHDKRFECLIRSSDLNLYYFDYFYQKTFNKTWLIIKKRAEFVLKYVSRLTYTGLIPDFLWVDNNTIEIAMPNSLESPHDNAYYWNANRIPWRLSTDNNVIAGKICSKFLLFFERQPSIFAGYQITGEPLVTYSSPAFLAPIALAAFRWGNNTSFKKMIIKNILNTPDRGEYYPDSINLLVLLEMLKES